MSAQGALQREGPHEDGKEPGARKHAGPRGGRQAT